MYIIYNNEKFEISGKADIAVAKIEDPVYVENGEEKQLLFEKNLNGVSIYSDACNRVEIRIEKKSNTLFYVHRSWKNIFDSSCKIQTIFRVQACFDVIKYLIPCVNLNGNEFGGGLEPKGLERDGKKWIFAYDRVSIPSCTLTENDEFALALFASDENDRSLKSACSISKNKENGAFVQEIYHPVIEAPVVYYTRDGYSEGYGDFIELAPEETFESGIYLSISKPKWKNYGICDVLDSALTVFGDNHYIKAPTDEDLWKRSIAFAKSLITDCEGKKGFIIGFLPNHEGGFSYRDDQCFELAWCGQNVLLSRMLIEDYIRCGNCNSLDEALEILDTRVKYGTSEKGLLATQLRHCHDLNRYTADTCNMGYGAYEFLRCYRRLKDISIDKPEYLEAARKLCDFFCENYSEEYGFGKEWRLDGVCLEKKGTIGAFMIPPMAELYRLTGEEKYLKMAEKALKFYAKRDLDEFCCTAGALDTDCVDKETSTPFIISAVLLYELTKDETYLEYGRKAAYYFTSWMFHYEPIYAENADVSKHNVYIKGLTSVSTQHHHLDMYAGLAVPYFYKLADYTGDESIRARGEIMWKAVVQFIGDGTLKIHDRVRPVGSQNEAVLHCHWGWTGEYASGDRGMLNDWLVAWPCAFRLSVLAEKEQWK